MRSFQQVYDSRLFICTDSVCSTGLLQYDRTYCFHPSKLKLGTPPLIRYWASASCAHRQYNIYCQALLLLRPCTLTPFSATTTNTTTTFTRNCGCVDHTADTLTARKPVSDSLQTATNGENTVEWRSKRHHRRSEDDDGLCSFKQVSICLQTAMPGLS